MKCTHEKCTRDARVNNFEYFPNDWYCAYHANKATKLGRIKRKVLKKLS